VVGRTTQRFSRSAKPILPPVRECPLRWFYVIFKRPLGFLKRRLQLGCSGGCFARPIKENWHTLEEELRFNCTRKRKISKSKASAVNLYSVLDTAGPHRRDIMTPRRAKSFTLMWRMLSKQMSKRRFDRSTPFPLCHATTSITRSPHHSNTCFSDADPHPV